MMAEVLGIALESLSRWMNRQEAGARESARRGRPEVMGTEVKRKIRDCFLDHYRQWGPSVLACWAQREGLGRYSPDTIARVIEDLKEPPQEKPRARRYEITAAAVMWSEDGTGFRERGNKKELLVVQDECARFKTNWRLASGPATGAAVVEYLEEAFKKYGAPLVLKQDGDVIFREKEVTELLDRYEVVSLTCPARYPPFNGKKERSMRDIKSYERAKRRYTRGTTLRERLAEAIRDLNEKRPRPILDGRTAREVFEQPPTKLPDRSVFRREVREAENELLAGACSRRAQAAARRKAVEAVLLRYGLFKEIADVSTNLQTICATN